MKVCIACSSGGHFQEMELIKDKFINQKDVVFLYSFKSKMYDDLNIQKYLFINPNRNILLHFLNFLNSLYVFLKEKPDVVLSNGAGIAYPMCIYAWLFRKRVIYIETF